MQHAPKYLRRSEAADYLQKEYGTGTVSTLAKLATVGGGPEYVKIGREVRYPISGLDTWMQGRMTHRASTSVVLDAAPVASPKPSDAGAARKGNAPALDSDQSDEAAA